MTLQRLARGYLARRKVNLLLKDLQYETHYAVLVQKHFRGNYVRARDSKVLPAVLRFRAKRSHDKRTSAALSIQCLFRQVAATERRNFLQICKVEQTNASTLIQLYARRLLAQKLFLRKRLFSDLFYYYRNMMLLKIQCFVRQCAARKKLHTRFVISLHYRVSEHAAVRLLQSRYRGVLGRRRSNNIRSIKNAAALNIQRVYRSSRVKHWKIIRWDLLSCHVRQRAAMEIEEAKKRHKSDSPERIQTTKDRKDVTLSSTGKNSDMEILIHAFGKTYIELRCLIFWNVDGLYRSCTIRGYDERIRLWQIDYDNDDNEWLDLIREQDRVMVNNGTCYQPFNEYRTPQLNAYLVKREKLQASTENQEKTNHLQMDINRPISLECPSQQKIIPPNQSCEKSTVSSKYEEGITSNQHDPASSNAHQCDLWMSAYVARGLLDQYYGSKTKESLEKLISSHVVKALKVSIGSVKTRNSDSNLCYFEELLEEIESIVTRGTQVSRQIWTSD